MRFSGCFPDRVARRLASLAGWRRQVCDLLAFAPASRWIVLACFAVYLVQFAARRVPFAAGYSLAVPILYCFGLCPELLVSGFFWQPVTYLFLHQNGAHLLLNTLAILLLGAGVEREIGTRRFLRLFLAGGIVGGLTWACFDLTTVRLASGTWAAPGWLHALAIDAAASRPNSGMAGHSVCIGASGGVFALLGACAALFPRRRVYLFFVWPVRARRLAVSLAILTALFLVCQVGNVAHLTHLAGGLAGYGYGRYLAAGGLGDEPGS